MFLRSAILVLCAAAVAGCHPAHDSEPSPTPELVDLESPPPSGMSSEGSQYFGYALPDDWESRSTGADGSGVVWEDSQGEARAWTATTTSVSAPDTPSDDVPDQWSTLPRFLADDLTLDSSDNIDVSHADAAFRYDITDPDERRHVAFEVYAEDPGKKLTLWLIDTDDEKAETIGSTLVAVSNTHDSPGD